MERYNFKSIEEKWQKFWEVNKTFATKIDKKSVDRFKTLNPATENRISKLYSY